VRTPVRSFDATSVTIGDRRIEAGAVIDGRGFHSGRPLDASWGYQKFVGLDVRLAAPHGLTRPILMDATVEQLEGFRFVYALPWDERTLLVEDTRYSDTPSIDSESFKRCLLSWIAARGWSVERIERQEQAALPIPLAAVPSSFDVPTVGVAGGFFHATTGYSLPIAAATAELIASLPELSVGALTKRLGRAAREHSSSMSFFRLLNRMLFRGLPPEQRVRIFESFYGHRQALIERFYSGHLTWTDKLAALRRGAPTVPFRRAASAALSLP
jgi:lycopene beta-cyclase